MVEDDLMSSTLGEVYETSCARYGRDSNVPITYFMEHLNPAIIGQLPPESVAELRFNIYNEITSKFVN
jgi:hypothetical protein